ALALRKTGQIHAFLRAGIDDQYPGFISDISDAQDAPNSTQATADVIEKYYGEHLYSRVPTLGGAWVRPNWGVAFIPADLSIDLNMNRFIGPAVAVTSYLDTT